jgi:hypothetical protein
MTAESFAGPKLRRGLIRRLRVQPSQITSSSFNVQVVEPAPAGYAIMPKRFSVRIYAAGAAFGSVGSNDNLVLRATDYSGVVLTQSITGVGFLDTAPTAFVLAVANPANSVQPLAGAAVVLAFGASADGISATNVTGYLDVQVEYDLMYVGQ